MIPHTMRAALGLLLAIAASQAFGVALPRQRIVAGIVAALKYRHPADQQSLELGDKLSRLGLRVVLEEVCAIGTRSPLASEIEAIWNRWAL